MINYKRMFKDGPTLDQPMKGDAGYDLRSLDYITLAPKQWTKKIRTNIAVEIPSGYVGLVKSRSGLFTNNSIYVFHGTIDSIYRGEILVALYNDTEQGYPILRGDKIAQMIITGALTENTNEVDELSTTERGSNGFGSTGR